jgi:hypothetical protein
VMTTKAQQSPSILEKRHGLDETGHSRASQNIGNYAISRTPGFQPSQDDKKWSTSNAEHGAERQEERHTAKRCNEETLPRSFPRRRESMNCFRCGSAGRNL